ncbi:hypothetical protein Hanom_Chr07g00654831 [Helianthus anomalus]
MGILFLHLDIYVNKRGELYQIRCETPILKKVLLGFSKNKEETAKPRGETLNLAVCSVFYLSHQSFDGLQRLELTRMT